MVLTEYTIKSKKVTGSTTFVMLSDFHDRTENFEEIFNLTKDVKPDAILVAGDLVDRHKKTATYATEFLTRCVNIAPTYFALGNHEKRFPTLSRSELNATGASILVNTYENFKSPSSDHFVIGGQEPSRNFTWMKSYENTNDFKILICHHPEYYLDQDMCEGLHAHAIDLIVSGHAHGGQIRIFGHGILSPGQGFFPKYTKGLIDNKLLIGTGVSNTGGIIPRLWNPEEVVVIHIEKA